MSDLEKKIWYYHFKGLERYLGPETGKEVINIAHKEKKVRIWKKGMKAWVQIEDSDLAQYLNKAPTIVSPPPPIGAPPVAPPKVAPPASVPRAPRAPPAAPKKFTTTAPKPAPKTGGGGFDVVGAIGGASLKLRKVQTKKPLTLDEMDAAKNKDPVEEEGLLGELARAQNKLKKRQQGSVVEKTTSTSSRRPASPEPSSPPKRYQRPSTMSSHERKLPDPVPMRNPIGSTYKESLHSPRHDVRSTGSPKASELSKKIATLSHSSWKLKAIEAILQSKE